MSLTLSTRLREETAGLHREAEQSALQTAFAQAELSRPLLALYVAQLHAIHSRLEEGLRELRGQRPELASLLEDRRFRAPVLEEDLRVLGEGALDGPVLPETRELVDSLEASAGESPIELLGHFYVLEGSTNGSHFLAKRLWPAYGMPTGEGLRHMDPYGDAQMATWKQFKTEVDALGFGEEEQDRILAAAKEMFRAIVTIGDAVLARAE